MNFPKHKTASMHHGRTHLPESCFPSMLTLCFSCLMLFVWQSATAQSLSSPIDVPNTAAAVPPAPDERNLTVSQAIDLALQHNGELGIARENVTNFEAQKEKARAQYLPKITNSSDASYLTNREGIVLPAGSFGAYPGTGPVPAKTLRIDQGANLTYSSRTYINQPVTQLFATHALNRAARMDVDTAKLKVEDQSGNVAVQVRQLYYGVIEAEAQLRAAETAVATTKENEREASREFEQGSALPLKVMEAHANVVQALNAALEARTTARDKRLQLNNTLGMPIDSRFYLIDGEKPGPDPQVLPPRDEAVKIALAKQPQVLIADRKVEKAKAELRIAEDAYLPQITMSAHESYQVGIALLSRNYGVFQGELNYELFDGESRRAQVRSQRALLGAAKLNLSNLQESTRVAVEVAYDRVDTAALNLQAKQQMVAARQEGVRVADARYAHGEILPSDRDVAHAQLAEAQAAERQAELDLSLAQSEARRTLGEIAR